MELVQQRGSANDTTGKLKSAYTKFMGIDENAPAENTRTTRYANTFFWTFGFFVDSSGLK